MSLSVLTQGSRGGKPYRSLWPLTYSPMTGPLSGSTAVNAMPARSPRRQTILPWAARVLGSIPPSQRISSSSPGGQSSGRPLTDTPPSPTSHVRTTHVRPPSTATSVAAVVSVALGYLRISAGRAGHIFTGNGLPFAAAAPRPPGKNRPLTAPPPPRP